MKLLKLITEERKVLPFHKKIVKIMDKRGISDEVAEIWDFLTKDLDIENYKEKKFENIFSKEWISLIVDSSPMCRSMGYKGWMLGSGMIWYQYSRDLFEKNEDEPWKNKYKNKSLTISHINNP